MYKEKYHLTQLALNNSPTSMHSSLPRRRFSSLLHAFLFIALWFDDFPFLVYITFIIMRKKALSFESSRNEYICRDVLDLINHQHAECAHLLAIKIASYLNGLPGALVNENVMLPKHHLQVTIYINCKWFLLPDCNYTIALRQPVVSFFSNETNLPYITH